MQFRGPAANGRKEKGDLSLKSECLSGIKFSGSGHIFGSLWIAYRNNPISVPSGNL